MKYQSGQLIHMKCQPYFLKPNDLDLHCLQKAGYIRDQKD